MAEKLGRLKPNGQILGYSPLSRLVELETLALGITGKRSLWEALLGVADEDARLDRASWSASPSAPIASATRSGSCASAPPARRSPRRPPCPDRPRPARR